MVTTHVEVRASQSWQQATPARHMSLTFSPMLTCMAILSPFSTTLNQVIGGGAPLPPLQPPHLPSDQHRRRPNGASGFPHQQPMKPRLPPEISTDIVVLAAQQLFNSDRQTQPLSSSKPTCDVHKDVISLTRVNRACFAAVMSHVLLPQINLTGVAQVQALQRSLELDIIHFASHLGRKTTRLSVRQDAQPPAASQTPFTTPRSSLYDSLGKLSDFERKTTPLLRFILSRCSALEQLHLESTPSALARNDSLSLRETESPALVRLKHNLAELSCLLTPWGGVGLEDLFVGVIRPKQPGPTMISQPWGRLTRLQIHGPAGFRLSLATASAIGSLPALTHLGLVMPNIVRDAGMGGDILSPPAALQLLVLTSQNLELLLLVGHDIEGYMGWSRLYRAWLAGLRLPHPASAGDGARSGASAAQVSRPTLRAQLVTAHARGFETAPHPYHFVNWMVARTKEGKQWQWSPSEQASEEGDDGSEASCNQSECKADADWLVTWDVQNWEVPVEQPPEGYFEETEGADGRAPRSESTLAPVEAPFVFPTGTLPPDFMDDDGTGMDALD